MISLLLRVCSPSTVESENVPEIGFDWNTCTKPFGGKAEKRQTHIDLLVLTMHACRSVLDFHALTLLCTPQEYYALINFVRPLHDFGTVKDFTAEYIIPIRNGQWVDSTPQVCGVACTILYHVSRLTP